MEVKYKRLRRGSRARMRVAPTVGTVSALTATDLSTRANESRSPAAANETLMTPDPGGYGESVIKC